MPELPEAEVVMQQIQAQLLGAQLTACWVGRSDMVREGLATRRWYDNAVLDEVTRYGKSVALGLRKRGERRYVVAELGMTGLLLFRSTPTASPQHVHARLSFVGGREPELRYWNPRRFGRLSLLDVEGLLRYRARRFGADSLTVSRAAFVDLLQGRRGRLKPLLMHQQVLAGIGNIYANEILFRAKLHPNRAAHDLGAATMDALYDAMQSVLREAIASGGSSVKDFMAPDGTEGQYKKQHRVYGKEGQFCFNDCGRQIFRLQSQRSAFVCLTCQPAPRGI